MMVRKRRVKVNEVNRIVAKNCIVFTVLRITIIISEVYVGWFAEVFYMAV